MSEQKFTADAQSLWDAIPDWGKARLLENVWCTHCSAKTTIINFHGWEERGDLILAGVCQRCGGKVARVIEGG